MLKLGRKVEYALISLLHMAELSDGDLASSREIAKRYHMPPEVLGKVLQALGRSNLVRSIQGVRGGYQLNRPLDNITLGQVIQAIEGPVRLTPCLCETYVCDQEKSCNIKDPVFHFQHQVTQFIFDVSLATFQQKKIILQNTYQNYELLERTI